LAQLREAHAVLISVEARFLRIETDWFEEIGVDLDLYFNTNTGLWNEMTAADGNARLSDFFYTGGTDANSGQLKPWVSYGTINQFDDEGNPVDPANTFNTSFTDGVRTPEGLEIVYSNTGFSNIGPPIRLGATNSGWSPIGVVNNSMSIVETIAAGAAPTFAQNLLNGAPALGFGMNYLDDIQVDLLVKATQADERSVSLASPRLTFFNGQESWISINEQQAYVASLTAVSGSGSGAFLPVVDTLNTGVMLHLKGAASSDRRYVTLNVDFQKSELKTFATTAATGAAGGGGQGGGGSTSFAAQVQLPTIKVQQLRVTTSVPDKGTAMLGGYRVTEEFETEAGVPLLSKIPYINRFFANRVTATSESTLLILLRPEIILQNESEDRLFPGLSESLRVGSAYTP
jgi:general secretion pathway protein D